MQTTTASEALRTFDLTSVYNAMNRFADPKNGDLRTRNRKKKNRTWCCYLVNDFNPATVRAERARCLIKVLPENSPKLHREIRETANYLIPYLQDSVQLIETHLSKHGNRTKGYFSELSAIKAALQEKLNLFGQLLEVNPGDELLKCA